MPCAICSDRAAVPTFVRAAGGHVDLCANHRAAAKRGRLTKAEAAKLTGKAGKATVHVEAEVEESAAEAPSEG